MISNFKMFELFNTEYSYPFDLESDSNFKSAFNGQNVRTLRYKFITKDNIKYNVSFSIYEDRSSRIDFLTNGIDNNKYSSIIKLINAGDSIKVFNTLKSIIYKHVSDIDKIVFSSSPDRIKFYEKLLDFLKIKYIRKGRNMYGNIELVAYITKN